MVEQEVGQLVEPLARQVEAAVWPVRKVEAVAVWPVHKVAVVVVFQEVDSEACQLLLLKPVHPCLLHKRVHRCQTCKPGRVCQTIIWQDQVCRIRRLVPLLQTCLSTAQRLPQVILEEPPDRTAQEIWREWHARQLRGNPLGQVGWFLVIQVVETGLRSDLAHLGPTAQVWVELVQGRGQSHQVPVRIVRALASMESIDPVVRPLCRATSVDFVQVPVEVPQSLLQDFVLIWALDNVQEGAVPESIVPAVPRPCQARSVGIAQAAAEEASTVQVLAVEVSTVPQAQVEPQHCQAM